MDLQVLLCMQRVLNRHHATIIAARNRFNSATLAANTRLICVVNTTGTPYFQRQPLRDVVAAARRISANQLHERIESAKWPHELKELGAAFDDMLQRLEESFARLSQFSSDLAHELRTPIANLVGEAEVAISKARTAEEYRNVVASSLEEYQRLARMIDSLLFLARADAPESHINPIDLDVQKELDGMRDFYGALADERGLLAELGVPALALFPVTDPQAKQILVGFVDAFGDWVTDLAKGDVGVPWVQPGDAGFVQTGRTVGSDRHDEAPDTVHPLGPVHQRDSRLAREALSPLRRDDRHAQFHA